MCDIWTWTYTAVLQFMLFELPHLCDPFRKLVVPYHLWKSAKVIIEYNYLIPSPISGLAPL